MNIRNIRLDAIRKYITVTFALSPFLSSYCKTVEKYFNVTLQSYCCPKVSIDQQMVWEREERRGGVRGRRKENRDERKEENERQR
jgi:hypothetical protein